MTYIWEEKTSARSIRPVPTNRRSSDRRAISLPARLAWKDQRGVNRFAAVMTRDVSDVGVFVESLSPLSIPLYRLVQFQLEPTVRETLDVPQALRQGRILSAVYRVSPADRTARAGFALRLMVEPKRDTASHAARATA